MNQGVPNETIIRHMQVERGKLLAEIDELKYEIEKRDKAITAFKKWQAKVADYKYQYWLREGIKLMTETPDEKQFNALFKLVNHWNLFESRFNTLKKSIKQMDAARRELINIIDIELLNSQNNENNE